jgi:hypothetical protein
MRDNGEEIKRGRGRQDNRHGRSGDSLFFDEAARALFLPAY